MQMATSDNLLLETGEYILLETGDKIILEPAVWIETLGGALTFVGALSALKDFSESPIIQFIASIAADLGLLVQPINENDDTVKR